MSRRSKMVEIDSIEIGEKCAASDPPLKVTRPDFHGINFILVISDQVQNISISIRGDKGNVEEMAKLINVNKLITTIVKL